MRKYAEVMRGFVVGFHERDDLTRPLFQLPRFAIRIDMLANPPALHDEFDGRRFKAPTRENPNLLPPPPTDREILEETRAAVDRILDLLNPGPP